MAEQTYTFQGIVRPGRAHVSGVGFVVTGTADGSPIRCEVSIEDSQVTVTVTTANVWNEFDLRNLVARIVDDQFSALAYLSGMALNVEIVRVLNPALDLDWIFGAEIPYLLERRASFDLAKDLPEMRQHLQGEHGGLMARCLRDLRSAMQVPQDTAFYCYRAIESLRQHYAELTRVEGGKEVQWPAFHKAANTTHAKIGIISDRAKPARHGADVGITDGDRVDTFRRTWDIVDAYIAQLPASSLAEPE